MKKHFDFINILYEFLARDAEFWNLVMKTRDLRSIKDRQMKYSIYGVNGFGFDGQEYGRQSVICFIVYCVFRNGDSETNS